MPRLSTMRVLIPQRDIQLAIMRPAGPAPMMRTSTSESACRGAMTGTGCGGVRAARRRRGQGEYSSSTGQENYRNLVYSHESFVVPLVNWGLNLTTRTMPASWATANEARVAMKMTRATVRKYVEGTYFRDQHSLLSFFSIGRCAREIIVYQGVYPRTFREDLDSMVGTWEM